MIKTKPTVAKTDNIATSRMVVSDFVSSSSFTCSPLFLFISVCPLSVGFLMRSVVFFSRVVEVDGEISADEAAIILFVVTEVLNRGI